MQTTPFGGPEVLELVDVPEPEAGPGRQLYDVSTAGVNYADTRQRRDKQQPLDHPTRLGTWRVQPKTIPPGDGRPHRRAVDMGEGSRGYGHRTVVSGSWRPSRLHRRE